MIYKTTDLVEFNFPANPTTNPLIEGRDDFYETLLRYILHVYAKSEPQGVNVATKCMYYQPLDSNNSFLKLVKVDVIEEMDEVTGNISKNMSHHAIMINRETIEDFIEEFFLVVLMRDEDDIKTPLIKQHSKKFKRYLSIHHTRDIINFVTTSSAFDFSNSRDSIGKTEFLESLKTEYIIDEKNKILKVLERMSFSDFECNDLYDAVFNHICGIYNKEDMKDGEKMDYKKKLLQVISMIVFEERINEARPSIVLWGESGRGKSLLIKLIENLVGKADSYKYDSREIENDRFTTAGKYRLIKMDELGDLYLKKGKVFDIMKEYSRQSTFNMELKGKDKITIPCTSYPVVATNYVPFMIPANQEEIPFMWARYFSENEPLLSENKTVYNKLVYKKYGGTNDYDLGRLLEKGSFQFLYTVLLDVFNELRIERTLPDTGGERRNYRFGVNLKITKEYHHLSLKNTQYGFRQDIMDFLQSWFDIISNKNNAREPEYKLLKYLWEKRAIPSPKVMEPLMRTFNLGKNVPKNFNIIKDYFVELSSSMTRGEESMAKVHISRDLRLYNSQFEYYTGSVESLRCFMLNNKCSDLIYETFEKDFIETREADKKRRV